ncbi:protein phosphatase 1 regulatory subunit 12A isoform X2 [Anopheles moucheti]|uniref:protein phosphatase 1 regulatory subunit 12A isoform X2 n=1 Tax=Anopheles moucheti TaxID=186751 RepID=UPI0022F0326F|nr:protein phosphatase 1 regulatory subunit 12A isoform X2 [Anopheles moucheti]
MSLDNRNTSAQFKRAEQLKRWEESEMNKKLSGVPKSPSSRRIKFSSGCIFLAACVAGDKEEVEWLLKNGADIDTANVDGLTALHQACIDDNLDMVEFLVQKGADVNRKDNEGWTPLHATASCGFLSIARYLIENGADLASINSDGELAVDLASSDAMEDLIQHHLDEQGIDCDDARQAEERIMLSDATKWLRTDSSDCDKAHPKTGATAIHVAAAKGYIGVLKLLLEGRGDIDRQDVDGWTPLHAAAYWGQKEATQMLLNASADIDIQNYSGQLAIDIAQDDIVPLLKDARKNVKRTKRRPPSHGNRITDNLENSTETPTKVIRVEVKPIDNNKQKEAGPVAVAHDDDDDDEDVESTQQVPSDGQEEPEEEEESNEKDEEEEEETMDDTVDEELDDEEEEEDGEEDEEEEEVDEDENDEQEQVVSVEKNKHLVQDVPDAIGGLSYQRVTAQAIRCDEANQSNQIKDADSEVEEEEEEEEEDASVSSEPFSSSNPSADSSLTESETDELLPRPVPIISRPAPVPLTTQIVTPKPRVTESANTTATSAVPANNPPPPTAPWRRQRAIPTPVPRQFYEQEEQPAQPTTVSRATDDVDYANLYFTSKRNLSEKENKPTEPDVILRRTQSFESDEKFYQRYAELRARIQANSCPHTILPSTPINTKTSTASNNNNNNNSSNTNNNNNNTTTTTASTPTTNISSYLVQRSASLKDHRTLRKTASNLVLGSTTTSPSSVTGPTTGIPTSIVPPTTGTATAVSQATNNTTGNATATSGAVSPPTSPSGTPTTTPTAGQIRRSFVPPTRDEESETQRKAHAKRVRETRRSTQGVTLDEIKSAEQLVKKKNASGSGNENDTMGSATATSASTTITPSSPSSLSSSASPSFTNNATTISGITTASINDRVPSVGEISDQQQSGNHVAEGPGKDANSEVKMDDVAVSASFTLAPPGSTVEDGGDGGGGNRRHRRSVSGNGEEEDDSKVTVSYTLSAPVRQSSPSRRATANNSKESTVPLAGSGDVGGDVPVVSATFHVPAVTDAEGVATTATIRTSATAGGVVSNSDSNTTSTITNTTSNNTTSASSNTNHNTAATYTKRSLFDIDNANSLTLAEKLRHEANKYAIAAVADGDLDSHLASRVPNSNSTTNSGGESNSNSSSTNALADNSVVSAAGAAAGSAVPPSPTLRKAADSVATTGVTAERRPSWRLKVDGGSKFKLEDASTPNAATQSSSVASGSVYESVPATQATEHGLITTKLTSSSALAQRRAQQQNGDTTTTGMTGSSVASTAIGSRPLSSSGLAAGEQYNRVPGSAATAAGEQTTTANSGDTSPLHHLRRPPKSTAGGEENKENDKENDNRSTAQATQAVIQRRRRQKRRSTGVVSVGIEDLDPDRQDSPVDGDEKETGSERGRSRVGSTASELDTANQPQDSTRENGGDCIDYKALYEQEKADNDKLKMALRKKDEEVVTLKGALDRFTTATTKNNSLSELEKRERRAMERKMSEMEEELKLLQKYKTENERLRAENRALTRVVSKLTTSAQNQVHANKQ